jgi:hypothetical protein
MTKDLLPLTANPSAKSVTTIELIRHIRGLLEAKLGA